MERSLMSSGVIEFIELGPYIKAEGTVALPGSKSISNRVLLLSALAKGTSTLKGLLDADDTQVMRAALKTLGVNIEETKEDCIVHGCSGKLPKNQADLFMGNAGTAIRPLTAALAILGGDYRLHGVPRMHERPIGDLVDGLRMVGAQVAYEQQEGYPPLRITQGQIRTNELIKVRGDVSSQFLTALLMSLPLVAKSEICIEVIGELISKPYIDITLKLMKRFGVDVRNDNWQKFYIPANDGQPYSSPGTLYVEGDASSASYFLAAGAIAEGPMRVTGVGRNSIQGDVAFADALNQMGANVMAGDDWIEVRGVDTPSGKLQGIELNCLAIPDAAMTLAVAALFAEGPTKLTGIASWKVKETDRIAAMAKELRKVGAIVDAGDDYIQITPPKKWQSPAQGIDTYDDHRMAMCFSLAALGPLRIRINDPACVAKTFPEYFKEFFQIAKSI
jgi:3-phosphoshikimate 1-carboxyvinyltransferase